ncbi:MAG: insulinase family protein [Bacteroidales bacterium]|jgi:predicted Zn-dependent peptidase|nr:insulinase family protein [Bacteroidales bacterium]
MKTRINNFQLPLLQAERLLLDNQTPIHYFPNEEMNAVRLEFLFPNAGKINQNKVFTATMTNIMMTEGTSRFSAYEIAKTLDYYGAFIGRTANMESSSIVFYFLKKHSEALIDCIEDIICRPIFPDNEFKININKYRQQHQINEKKTDFNASNKFHQSIFPSHPYGAIGKLCDYDLLLRNDLVEFYNNFIADQNSLTIIASGNIDRSLLNLINRSFGALPRKTESPVRKIDFPVQIKPNDDIIRVNVPMATQVSLRLGRQTITCNDNMWMSLKVLNCAFGGYFGSRLMSNIREQKGLSYGINSILFSYKKAGVIYVSADVKANEYELAIKEIRNEMDILRNEKMKEEELNRIKNYLKGEIMRSLDGSFDLSERYAYLLSKGMPTDYHSKFLETVNTITTSDLQTLTAQYLAPETFIQVAAGKF